MTIHETPMKYRGFCLPDGATSARGSALLIGDFMTSLKTFPSYWAITFSLTILLNDCIIMQK